MIIKVIEFDGDYIALVKEQNDWTGNYSTEMRTIHGKDEQKTINWYGDKLDVSEQYKQARAKYQAETAAFMKDYEARKRG